MPSNKDGCFRRISNILDEWKITCVRSAPCVAPASQNGPCPSVCTAGFSGATESARFLRSPSPGKGPVIYFVRYSVFVTI